MSSFKLTSPVFSENGSIPRKYGYKQDNKSPPLIINHIPENTKSLALIMDDPDAVPAVGKLWVHWVLWNIDPQIQNIEESVVPTNAIEGKNDFGEIGYGGPAPPDKEHTYVFKLYALNTKLSLSEGMDKSKLEDSMKNHIIEETSLKGKFSP